MHSSGGVLGNMSTTSVMVELGHDARAVQSVKIDLFSAKSQRGDKISAKDAYKVTIDINNNKN